MKNKAKITKKTWLTPSIVLLATDHVNGGGAKPAFREGGPAGGGLYKLNTPGGISLGAFPKGAWNSYQHS